MARITRAKLERLARIRAEKAEAQKYGKAIVEQLRAAKSEHLSIADYNCAVADIIQKSMMRDEVSAESPDHNPASDKEPSGE